MKFRSLRNRRVDQDIEDELRSHVEMRAEALEAEGVSRPEALHEARRRFGNLTRTKENTREMHVFTVLSNAAQDLRYAARRLRREPSFTVTAVLTLGLIIGANGAIFSVFEAVLLRPLPFPDADRLIAIHGTNRDTKFSDISIPDLENVRSAKTLTQLAAIQVQSVNLTGVDEPGRLIGGFVSASYFDVLGVKPLLGRGMREAEEKPGGAGVCLLNYSVWQSRFGADPNILGRSLVLNAQAHSIIGVLPESFQPRYTDAEVWLPIWDYPGYSLDRTRTSAAAIARLAPGADLEQARSELAGIASRLAREYPETNRERGISAQSLREIATFRSRDAVIVLTGAATCVLLLGCANIAGLLLTRAMGRGPEMAIRASLGASSGRLARQLLTESLLLALAGGIVGAVFASGGMTLLQLYTPDLLAASELKLNPTVLGYLAGTSVVTGLLFGMAPAVTARRQTWTSLRLRGVGGGKQRRAQNYLVVCQVALAIVPLIAAGLMATSAGNVASINPGFKGERVLTMEYRLPRNKYNDGRRQTALHQAIVARVSALPGVQAAALVGALPFSGNVNRLLIASPTPSEQGTDSPVSVEYNPATPSYFATAGVPLLEGRDFSPADRADTQRVAVVNRTLAERFWPGERAVGRQVKLLLDAPVAVTIVGVVGNVKQNALDDPKRPQLYRPYAQDPSAFATLAVRTSDDPTKMTKSIQRAIWSVDKDQPMWKIRTLQFLVYRSYSHLRYITWFLGCFAVLALGLAAIGLYGLLTYTVNRRIPELGIRMAIGASPYAILRLVVQNGLVLTATGIVAGLGGALVVTRLLQSQLYGVSSMDPAVYAVMAGLLLFVAFVAVLLPARRAMKVDPVNALRQE